LAKFEKTGAYTCSGTARRQPLAVALHNFLLDRGGFSRDAIRNGGRA